jgi:hypothetical protein
MMAKYLCLACEVLARPLYLCAARSPHIIDIQLVQKGLHNTPAVLRQHLQEALERAEGGDGGKGYDAILLGYGLCGQATAGLSARETPLVIPRAHDCITLFLGSRERYQQQFIDYPGTYWYAQDYIEREDGSGAALSMGSGTDTDLQAVYDEYVQKYGQDNADYLMEVMGEWKNHYQRAAYIDMGFGGGEDVEQKAQDEAARRGWRFERLAGDLVLMRRLLNGDWKNDFLVLQPGQKIRMSYDHNIITSE